MKFIETIKLLEPGEQMRRKDWPYWVWVYLQPSRGHLMFNGKGINAGALKGTGIKPAFDVLSLDDTLANDWFIRVLMR